MAVGRKQLTAIHDNYTAPKVSAGMNDCSYSAQSVVDEDESSSTS